MRLGRVLGAAFLSCNASLALACTPIEVAEDGLGWVEDPSIPQWASYRGATDVYSHGVLGDKIEGSILTLSSSSTEAECGMFTAYAGDTHVFEDTAPRLFDMDGDGKNEVIATRSHFQKGAQLVVYKEGREGRLEILAATPYIGQRFRWLSVVGAGDLDGDGQMEIAYVDRPHLAKTIRIVNIQGDQLVEEAAATGVTNHRIGERDIAGGIRDCGNGLELIVASADWSQLLAVRYDGTTIAATEIGRDTTRPAFAEAMACR